MVKHKMAYTVAVLAMIGSLGTFGSAQTWAEGCSTAESLKVPGQVSNEEELRYAIVTAGISEVAVAEDFDIVCTNISGDETYIAKDFTIDLNGKTITAKTPWALDIEGAEANGKTLTIKDSSGDGAFEFDDAGIWVDNGANLKIDSGTIRGIGGRGRGISLQRGGKFIMNDGLISGTPTSYQDGGRTYWYNLVQVLGEESTAEINGGKIAVTSGDGRAFYSVGVNTNISDAEIVSDGNYAVEVDQAILTMNSGAISSKQFGIVLFDGAGFVMEGGVVTSDSIAITGNGTSTGDKITINDGMIQAGELGIYAPQVDGVTTINGGNIEAKTGVEVRAGALNINGGSIVVSDGAKYEVIGNGSGSTTTGAAVAVAQHTTRKPISVNITGGTFVGPVAFSEADPQDGDPVDVNLSISGGAFVGDIVSENYDLKDFVKSGDFSNYFENDERNASININGPVVADSPISFVVNEVEKSALTLADNGNKATLVAAFDFSLRDENGATVSVNKEDGTELTISVIITDEQYEALKDKKVMVAFFNEDGVETGERIEATLTQREDGVWVVTFATNHLSTYGIIGVENGSEEGGSGTPETGTMTAAGASATNAAIVTAVAVGILVSIASFAYLIRRR